MVTNKNKQTTLLPQAYLEAVKIIFSQNCRLFTISFNQNLKGKEGGYSPQKFDYSTPLTITTECNE